MCYQKFHECNYCHNLYPCDENDYNCPTINHDEDMELCEMCKKKLEDKLKSFDMDEIDVRRIEIKDILLGDNNED